MVIIAVNDTRTMGADIPNYIAVCAWRMIPFRFLLFSEFRNGGYAGNSSKRK